MKLFFRELGEGSPIVILHGVFGTSDNWFSISKELSQGYHLYLLDLRNHGQSPHSEEFNYKVMAEDLNLFLEEHSIVNPVIIGHSMGGKVAMRFASEYTNYSKLIIVDISPRYYRKHHESILNGMNALDLISLQNRQQADTALAVYEPDLGVRQFILKNLYRDSTNHFAWRINLKVLIEKIENVGEALDENNKIEKPTLFIKGEKSNYIQEKDQYLIYKIFKNVSFHTILGAGHWLQAEKPQEFLACVNNFLKI